MYIVFEKDHEMIKTNSSLYVELSNDKEHILIAYDGYLLKIDADKLKQLGHK